MEQPTTVSRRGFLRGIGGLAVAGGAGLGLDSHGAPQPSQSGDGADKRWQGGASPWPLALNASTIRPTPVVEKLEIAARTGWDAFEPWIDDLEKYEAEHGSLKEFAKRAQDLGLFINNVIGLWSCMPEGEEAFQASLPATRERMRRCSEAGAHFVAAIPAPDRPDFDPKWAIHCYRELMRIGREDYNLRVAFEFVGFLKGIYRFGEAAGIALDTNDDQACLIMDSFHLFRGGSGFNCLRHVQGDFIANFHVNDVPGNIPREEQGDEHRLYPGDGILPLERVFQDLKAIRYRRPLSLEIFKREYWAMPPEEVAARGKAKLLEVIARAEV